QYLDIIKESASSLMKTVNELMDFAKLDAGKIDLKFAEFSLRELISGTLESLGSNADEKGLELNYRVDAQVPDKLIGDSFRLRQIIVNLVGNAIKFTSHGNVAVHVDAETASHDGILLRFGVRDTGVGIPSDIQERIFDSF